MNIEQKLINSYCNKAVKNVIKFDASGTFGAVRKAESRASELGYTRGSMCRDEPIGLAWAEEVQYIAKWYNIDAKDRAKLNGVLLSDDFREGDVWLVEFK